MENALNPNISIWVNASAGSGKTTLLVNRIISLILAKKTNILCLTFTNNAVDEIKNRVKTYLTENIKDNVNIKNIINDLDKILTVSTIHSFCQNILSNYCIEFSSWKINNDTQKKFYQYAINDYLEEEIIETSTTKELTELRLNKIVNKLFPVCGNVINDSTEIIKNELIKLKKSIDDFNQTDLCQYYFSTEKHSIITMLQNGKGIKEKEFAKLLQNNEFEKAFLNCKGEMKNINSIITKETMEKNKKLFSILFELQEKYFCYYHDNAFNKIIEDSCKLFNVLHIIYKKYLLYKKNDITYNDLIHKTISLINESSWVLFEIDKITDHILVDEAQDNNAYYWEIIYKICEEFFAGSGSKKDIRTLFVVGDLKQSIYGFQDSSPQIFEDIKNLFLTKTPQNWKVINLDICYRCSINILKFVDQIFFSDLIQKEDCFKDYKKHIPNRKEEGKVEIWPLEKGNSKQKLANQIATKIHSLITDSTIKLSDIAILIRHKTDFIDFMINELSNLGIKINSTDINHNNPILDVLINIGKTVLWDNDDYSLFKILSSGIFEITAEEILLLCYKRKKTLYEELHSKKPQIYYKIHKLKQNIEGPFEIYSKIIFDKDIRKKITNLFGENALEIAEIFLESCTNYFSLVEFIEDFEANIINLKFNTNNNAITISTIHKAKGMEFPIVILTDTTTIPKNDDCELLFTEKGIPIWTTNSNIEKILQLKNQQQKKSYSEYLRLLYVALTRAKNELFICGWDEKAAKGSWYDIIIKTNSKFLLSTT